MMDEKDSVDIDIDIDGDGKKDASFSIYGIDKKWIQIGSVIAGGLIILLAYFGF